MIKNLGRLMPISRRRAVRQLPGSAHVIKRPIMDSPWAEALNARRIDYAIVETDGHLREINYRITIQNVSRRDLQTRIAEKAGIPYLKEATTDEAIIKKDSSYAFFYSSRYHIITSMIVGHGSKACWVFFVFDTNFPYTYLSKEV